MKVREKIYKKKSTLPINEECHEDQRTQKQIKENKEHHFLIGFLIRDIFLSYFSAIISLKYF